MGTARFLLAVSGTAILVPCAGSGIQMGIISARNGHGFLLAALVDAVHALPLAILTAPLNAVGAICLGAFSLGLESLIRRSSIWIWLFHGLAIGFLGLIAFSRRDPGYLVVSYMLGGWLLGGLAMWAMLSRRQLDDDLRRCRDYSSSSS